MVHCETNTVSHVTTSIILHHLIFTR